MEAFNNILMLFNTDQHLLGINIYKDHILILYDNLNYITITIKIDL